jgi:hypothetical protein
VAVAPLALVGVALQTGHGHAKLIGAALSWTVWAVFALQAAVMLSISPSPASWARGHAFDLAVLVLTWPVWALAARDILVVEVAPALTLLEATKLVKLAKVARAVHLRASGTAGRAFAVGVVLAAAAVAALVLAT